MKKCVFAGTFDPPTAGHEKIINTCLKIFDEVVVAIMLNPEKQPYFTVEERLYLLNKLYGEEKKVKVITFSGTAADLLESENTPFYIRGIRNTVDFEYENANYFASKKLNPNMVALYIPAEQGDIHISSTMVKNHIKFGKDYSVYLPEKIREDVKKIADAKRAD